MTLPDTNMPSAPTDSTSLLCHGVPWPNAERLAAFQAWLARMVREHSVDGASARPASADASFRRYLRVDATAGAHGRSLIIMDAPPQHEDCRPFVTIDRLLCEAGVGAPHILDWDEAPCCLP
jgi:N-acetylmuramate 1-kinase